MVDNRRAAKVLLRGPCGRVGGTEESVEEAREVKDKILKVVCLVYWMVEVTIYEGLQFHVSPILYG